MQTEREEEGSQEEEVENNEGKLFISIQLEQLEGEDNYGSGLSRGIVQDR